MIKRIVIFLLVLLNIGCDQLSKQLVRKNVDHEEFIPVIGEHLILTKVENTGAMMGWGQSLPPILKIVFLQAIPIIVLLVLLFRILWKTNMDKWLILAFALVIGGGIGNLMDRIAYGSVTDFFIIKLGLFKTGIFNMADVSVTTGVLLLLLLSLRSKKSAIE